MIQHLLDDDYYFDDISEAEIEVAAERKRQRIEWDSCHDEPCPESELTPYPTKED